MRIWGQTLNNILLAKFARMGYNRLPSILISAASGAGKTTFVNQYNVTDLDNFGYHYEDHWLTSISRVKNALGDKSVNPIFVGISHNIKNIVTLFDDAVHITIPEAYRVSQLIQRYAHQSSDGQGRQDSLRDVARSCKSPGSTLDLTLGTGCLTEGALHVVGYCFVTYFDKYVYLTMDDDIFAELGEYVLQDIYHPPYIWDSNRISTASDILEKYMLYSYGNQMITQW